jgi:hypothetical protein
MGISYSFLNDKPPGFNDRNDDGGMSKLFITAEPHSAMSGFNEGQE